MTEMRLGALGRPDWHRWHRRPADSEESPRDQDAAEDGRQAPGQEWGGEVARRGLGRGGKAAQVQTKSMDLLPQPSWAAEVKLNRLAASAAGTDTLGGGRRWEAGAGWGLLGLGWGLLVSWDP